MTSPGHIGRSMRRDHEQVRDQAQVRDEVADILAEALWTMMCGDEVPSGGNGCKPSSISKACNILKTNGLRS